MEGEVRINNRSLPDGSVLAGQYEIVSVLGEGGFAITYMGNNKDGKNVAVKEYFPSSFAVRENGKLKVFSETKELFEKGKKRFIKEAEVLREFQHLDGIATVYDCFEENDTAYIVMEYIEGITLGEYVIGQGVLSYKELVTLLSPVIKALAQIHRHGVIHRDISPDNIIIGLDNKARLIDFGAAGIVGREGIINNMNNVGNETVGLEYRNTVILKAGYAPPEQYIEGGRLGSWTDVYGLAATLYMGVTGHVPMDTVERLQRGEKETEKELYTALVKGSDDKHVVDNIEGKINANVTACILPWQARAILTGLSLNVDDRYSDMGEFYEALTVEPSIEHDVTVMGNNVSKENTKYIEKRMKQTGSNRFTLILAVISLALVIILSIVVGMMIVEQKRMNNNDVNLNGQKLTADNITSDENISDTIVDKNIDKSDDSQISEDGDEAESETQKKQNTAETTQSAIEKKQITTETTQTVTDKRRSVTETNTENKTPTAEQAATDNSYKDNKKNTTEKKTTEAINIHEEDSVEHLDIEE